MPTGATGTGKTVYMTSQINALNTSVYQNIQTAFSAQTSANQIQDIIDLKLDKRRKVPNPAVLPICKHFIPRCILTVAYVYSVPTDISTLCKWDLAGYWTQHVKSAGPLIAVHTSQQQQH